MATTTTPKTEVVAPAVKAVKAKRAPVAFAERIKTQLTGMALRNKLTVEEIEVLEAHLAKLKALLA